MQYDAFYITSDYWFILKGAEAGFRMESYQSNRNSVLGDSLYKPSFHLSPQEHPRLLFCRKDIGKIKHNLTNEQNIAVYKKFLTDAQYVSDGTLREIMLLEVEACSSNIPYMTMGYAWVEMHERKKW